MLLTGVSVTRQVRLPRVEELAAAWAGLVLEETAAMRVVSAQLRLTQQHVELAQRAGVAATVGRPDLPRARPTRRARSQ